MMMTDLRPTHAREERFGVVRVDPAFQAVGFLMVDPVHREAAVKLVPGASLVGIDLSAPGDSGADEIERRDLGSEYARQSLAVALANHDHRPTFARLVLP